VLHCVLRRDSLSVIVLQHLVQQIDCLLCH
jgi:hypothetical protein